MNQQAVICARDTTHLQALMHGKFIHVTLVFFGVNLTTNHVHNQAGKFIHIILMFSG